MRKFIIDTDAGVDDAVALVLALRNKNVDVIDITCSWGNTSLSNVIENVRCCVAASGDSRPQITVGDDMGLNGEVGERSELSIISLRSSPLLIPLTTIRHRLRTLPTFTARTVLETRGRV